MFPRYHVHPITLKKRIFGEVALLVCSLDGIGKHDHESSVFFLIQSPWKMKATQRYFRIITAENYFSSHLLCEVEITAEACSYYFSFNHHGI